MVACVKSPLGRSNQHAATVVAAAINVAVVVAHSPIYTFYNLNSFARAFTTVSYTHLTLPTICSV